MRVVAGERVIDEDGQEVIVGRCLRRDDDHKRVTDERTFRNAQGLDPTDDFLAEGLRHFLCFPREPTATLRRSRHDPQDKAIVSI